MPENRVNKYLGFDEIANPGKKTRVWQLILLKPNCLTCLGEVRWYGGWRKYVFVSFGESGQYWDSDALRLIAEFLEKENRTHRATRSLNA